MVCWQSVEAGKEATFVERVADYDVCGFFSPSVLVLNDCIKSSWFLVIVFLIAAVMQHLLLSASC